jgi:hypothetical protein
MFKAYKQLQGDGKRERSCPQFPEFVRIMLRQL